MATLTMKELLEAGVHFGHQTKRWNPKMQTVHLRRAQRHPHHRSAEDRSRSSRRPTTSCADRRRTAAACCSSAPRSRPRRPCSRRPQRCGMFYVNQPLARRHAHQLHHHQASSIARLKHMEEMRDGTFERLPKKEVWMLEKERQKLEKNLGGIKNMEQLPAVVFIVDPRKEAIAVAEAQQAGHPHRGHRGHQLRPDGHRLPHPRQRRRHPRHSPDHLPRGRRHQRGPGDLGQGRGGRRGGAATARATWSCPSRWRRADP